MDISILLRNKSSNVILYEMLNYQVKFSPFINYALCYSLFTGILGREYECNLEDKDVVTIELTLCFYITILNS